MAPTVANLLVGKIGSAYVVPYGTSAPFTIPPSATFDITAAVLPAAWLAGELGYLHESDTPEFSWDINNSRITAWQANGQTLRTVMNAKNRMVKWTLREFNRRVWNLVEPGTTWTAGANGSYSASIPAVGTNPPKAGLFEINDQDAGYKVWWYVPRFTVNSLGAIKAANTDTMNAQLEMQYEQVDTVTPLYYVVGNHPGLAS